MKKIISIFLILLMVGCSTAITRDEAKNLAYDCSDVDLKLAKVIEEREKNNKRILSGISSIIPVRAVINVMKGNYRENAAIATGEWAKVLDKKIVEMQAFKAQC